jgi:dTMP kinase
VLPRLDKGVLIAIEGIDGAGKTTQAERIASCLSATGLPVLRTKEPTDGPWGRKLRASAHSGRLSAQEELALFVSDRKEHIQNVIGPALSSGKIVIVDRYYFSTVAYQGARGVSTEEILRLNEDFAPQPDLLVFLDVDPVVGLQRIFGRGDKGNHFEEEVTLQAAANVFRAMAFPFMLRISGTLPAEEITLAVLDRLYSGPLSTRDRADASVGLSSIGNDDIWMATFRASSKG